MKSFFIFLIVLSVNNLLVETIKTSATPHVRVRKSIHSLDPVERKALFWSIKSLYILPPPDSFTNWNILSFLNIPEDNLTVQERLKIKPQSIHQLLMASHISSCQHNSIYFSYYHRHLTVIAELWINFAHSILKGGKGRLLQYYNQSVYKAHEKQWDTVFAQYRRDGCSKIEQMSLHYWDIADYRSKQSILVPIQLVSPDHADKELDAMDQLFYRVRNRYPWEYSVKRFFGSMNFTWEELQKRMFKKQMFNNIQQDKQAYYTKEQLLIIRGNIGPRSPPEKGGFKQYLNQFLTIQSNRNSLKQEKVALRRLKQYFFTKGNNDTLPIQSLSHNQLFLNFGANFTDEVSNVTYRNHFITKKERKRMNYAYSDTKVYNMMKPHYPLALSLTNDIQTPLFKSFIKKRNRFQYSHNLRHNFYGFILRDPLISILGAHFFIFHSGIDMQLQLKIRLQNSKDILRNYGEISGYNDTYEYLVKTERNPSNQMITKMLLKITEPQIRKNCLKLFKDKIQAFLSSMQEDSLSALMPKYPRNKIGSYLIFDYNDPLFANKVAANQYDPQKQEAFQPAFPFIDYVLTQTDIRSSLNLSEIYRKFYFRTQGKKYEGIVDFASYPFDYTYEVYNGRDRPAELLNSEGSNPPLYLQEMREEVQEIDDRLKANIRHTIDRLYQGDFGSFGSLNPALAQLYRSDPAKHAEVIKDNLFKTYNNTLFSRFYAYVRYPLPTEDEEYQIRLRLAPNSSCRSSVVDSLRSFGLDQRLIDAFTSRRGVIVSKVYAHPRKGECRKCPRHRQLYLDWGADLYERNPQFWVAFNRLILGRSGVFDDELKCVSNSTELYARSKKGSAVTVAMVKGAKRVNYMMSFEGAAGDPAQVSMNIMASLDFRVETAWPQPHQAPLSVSQEFQSLYGLRSFLSTVNDDSQQQVYNRFQTKFYKSLKGYIMKDELGVQDIELEVPFFYNELNLNVKWSYLHEDSIQPQDYVIEDLDYQFKKNLFENYQF